MFIIDCFCSLRLFLDIFVIGEIPINRSCFLAMFASERQSKWSSNNTSSLQNLLLPSQLDANCLLTNLAAHQLFI